MALSHHLQREARAIEAYEGEDEDDADGMLGTGQPEPAWLRKLLGDEFFSHVVRVAGDDSFTGSKPTFTDAGLEHLDGLTRLQSLDLDATLVTDAGLSIFKG